MKLHARLAVLVCVIDSVFGKNILGLFPFGAKSHFVIFDSLMRELARLGHSVVVCSPFPLDSPIANYTSINLQSVKEVLLNTMSFDDFTNVPPSPFEIIHYSLLEINANGRTLIQPEVRNLFEKETPFDLVFVEVFSDEVFLLMAKEFGVPIIGIASCYPFSWAMREFGVPNNPSYLPSFTSGYTNKMTFIQRFGNALLILLDILQHEFVLRPASIDVFERQLGRRGPALESAGQDVSLFLVNTHWSYYSARPYAPQVVEVGGLHVRPARLLPQDLDRWMNESTHGVVYFSFGSMLRGATLPVDKVQAFLQVFRLLPQRILWKWEDDAIEGLPNNVKVMKWLPQRDVLAHPNVKAFISHGGLLGTTEAVVSGVPILGIPMYGDQPNNVAALVENGVAVHVDYNNISVASLAYALNALLNDKSYRENAAQLARRFLDRPMSPLDTAVYWTEYVIRHGGAPHLRSAAVSLAWYQYYLLDVVAVCLAALLVFIAMIYYSLRTFLRILCTAKPTKLKSN